MRRQAGYTQCADKLVINGTWLSRMKKQSQTACSEAPLPPDDDGKESRSKQVPW